MPSSGSGTGTPVGGGGAPLPTDALEQPLPLTILSLSSYARVMGITPAHFWGITAHDLNPQVFPTNTCASIWYQYSWQDADKVSRWDIAAEIARAEEEIANLIGFYPGPVWVEGERISYPRIHRRDYYGTGLTPRANFKGVSSAWGKIIEVGKRNVDLVDYASVAGGGLVYSDEDGDGFYETATVAVETAVADIKQLKVYHAGHDGEPAWEIRQPRRKYLSGGYVYFIFDSWLLVDPALYEWMTTDLGASSINASTTANFVAQVDVYREYPDMTDEQALFLWQNEAVGCGACSGAGCEVCGYVQQDGCMSIGDYEQGILIPRPASYSADDSQWNAENWSGGREPDLVELNYRCGVVSREYSANRNPEPVPMELAKAIAFMATARLERPLCGCTNVEALSANLRKDVTRSEPGTPFIFTTGKVADNPFGTLVGEVAAWRLLNLNYKRRARVAVI